MLDRGKMQGKIPQDEMCKFDSQEKTDQLENNINRLVPSLIYDMQNIKASMFETQSFVLNLLTSKM